jgi:pre-mRNA-splicing helicase BRR2
MDDIDETTGVPVQFESDEEDDRMVTELKDDKSDEDDDVGVEADYEGTLRTGDGFEDGKGIGEVFKLQSPFTQINSILLKKHDLNPRDIDAHWVKRYLSKHFDPNESQQKAQEVLNILKVSNFIFKLTFFILSKLKFI